MITQERQPIVLQPQGRLDSQGGKALRQHLNASIPHRNQLWIIDLAQVDFMDSAGLVALVTGLKAPLRNGCRLVLCNVQAPVRLVLELTQLDRVFEIFESYDDVLAEFNLFAAAA